MPWSVPDDETVHPGRRAGGDRPYPGRHPARLGRPGSGADPDRRTDGLRRAGGLAGPSGAPPGTGPRARRGTVMTAAAVSAALPGNGPHPPAPGHLGLTPDGLARRARPLTGGERRAVTVTGVLAAVLGLTGFANSFRAVADAARASFGPLAVTVPA